MGNGESKDGGCLWRKGRGQADLKLPGCRLRFSKEQLSRLNLRLARLEQHSHNGESEDLQWNRTRSSVEVVVERLVQRLVCGAGQIDPRFSSKFLLTLDGGPSRHVSPAATRRTFKYLVRLDKLSSPALYPEEGGTLPPCRVIEGGDGVPQGFAKIRIQGEGFDQWAEFINSSGFLRRDKIQERFVDLLAQAAARASNSVQPENVDESTLCGSPGKIMDVGILDQILRLPPNQQVFYGPAGCNQNRYPDPRDFRIAIVEGAPEISLRIGFLSPALATAPGPGRSEDVEVKLILAAGSTGWPQSSDFPFRAPLGHIDCLLFQKAAQTGFYLVPGPPHPTVRCDDRTATWQLWVPAAELCLLTHYSGSAVPTRILAVVEAVVQQLRGRTSRRDLAGLGLPVTTTQEFLRVVSRYMVRTFLWFQLELTVPGATAMLQSWSPEKVSSYVLQLLDSLMVSLRTQRHRSYFFPWCNVMLNSASRGQHHTEEDYLSDASILEGFLRSLHEDSSVDAIPAEEDADVLRYVTAMRLETALVRKWRDVLTDLSPVANTRSRRLCFGASGFNFTTAGAAQYTARQLDYIGHVFREMLTVRQLTLQGHIPPSWFQGPLQTTTFNTVTQEDPVEDLIYLLSAILEQAKEQSLDALDGCRTGKSAKQRRSGRCTNSKQTDTNHAFRNRYDASVSILIDMIRRDVETTSTDLSNDILLVRQVLKWLYKALDENRRVFGPVLRPYLGHLFSTSHENCWHLEDWRKRHLLGRNGELKTLGTFCRLVVDEDLSSSKGLIDAASKNWIWAEDMMEMAEYSGEVGSEGDGLSLVFTPRLGRVVRHVITLPTGHVSSDILLQQQLQLDNRYSTCSSLKSNYSRSRSAANTLRMKKATLNRYSDLTARLHNAGLLSEPYPCTQPPHCRLRDCSPLTAILDAQRRYGQHRGVGDVVQALLALNKFSVLQELSGFLPDGERSQMLDAIHRVAKESRRAHHHKRRTGSDAKQPVAAEPVAQTYRPKDESGATSAANERLAKRDEELSRELDGVRILGQDSILGTCRAARSQHGFRQTVLGGSAAYNGAFLFSSATSQDNALYAERYSRPYARPNVALLQLTDDKQLRFASPDEIVDSQIRHGGYDARVARKKRDIVTKL